MDTVIPEKGKAGKDNSPHTRSRPANNTEDANKWTTPVSRSQVGHTWLNPVPMRTNKTSLARHKIKDARRIRQNKEVPKRHPRKDIRTNHTKLGGTREVHKNLRTLQRRTKEPGRTPTAQDHSIGLRNRNRGVIECRNIHQQEFQQQDRQ